MNEKGRTQRKAKVVGQEDVAPEVLASAIVEVAAATRKLLAGPLNERAIIVLLKDSCGPTMPIAHIKMVLNHAANLDQRYLKKSARKGGGDGA